MKCNHFHCEECGGVVYPRPGVSVATLQSNIDSLRSSRAKMWDRIHKLEKQATALNSAGNVRGANAEMQERIEVLEHYIVALNNNVDAHQTRHDMEHWLRKEQAKSAPSENFGDVIDSIDKRLDALEENINYLFALDPAAIRKQAFVNEGAIAALTQGYQSLDSRYESLKKSIDGLAKSVSIANEFVGAMLDAIMETLGEHSSRIKDLGKLFMRNSAKEK
jgi:chromosome segregation ATPase